MGAHDQWDYLDDTGRGPSEWSKFYPAGKLQSPINIQVDYCALHQSSCGNCSPENHRQLSERIENGLRLGRESGPQQQPQQSARRHHLDSVGNDNDSDDPHESAKGEHNERLASDCLNLWKNKKLSNSPLQMRNAHAQQQQQQSDRLTKPERRQNTRFCVTNKKIFLGYPRFLNTVKLSNTGHGWQVEMPPELACHTLLCGPPLGDREYRLAQFHCHWGADCSRGSEHQVNGRSFSAELHFVHWNCSQFGSAREAARHRHGLAVLAVFLQAYEGEQGRNKHLDKLMGGVRAVRHQANASTELENTKLDLKKLFPSNRWDYASYEGSLTTPPLSEVVDWIVFLQPVECSASQLGEFRRLKCPNGSLLHNCRPVQAHNQRLVSIWTHSHSH